jgi:hypothetical protein
MQRAELLAELERLAAEAASARVRLAEAHSRLRSLSERIAPPADRPAAELPLHSAG